MNNIKISVIVPVYNVESYICECLDSIINQTYTNLEIILVDDGSKDLSGKICDQYAEKDKRIKVIHQHNGGHISARKAGVAIATGDYITFVDSDDWLELNAYLCSVNKIIEYECDIVIFGHNKINKNRVLKCCENLPDGLYNHYMIKEWMELHDDVFYHRIITPVCWNKLIKTSIVKKNIFKVDNRIKIGEDAALIFPCIMLASNIYVVDKTLYNYRIRTTSIMYEEDVNRCKSVGFVVDRLIDALRENNFIKSNIMQKQLALYVANLMLITDVSYFFNDLNLLYPQLKKNHRIALYGKGVYAQNLSFLVKKNNNYSISGCFDSSSLDELDFIEYDYIIIATTVSSFAEEMFEILLSKKIPSEKILYLRNSCAEQLGRKMIDTKIDII